MYNCYASQHNFVIAKSNALSLYAVVHKGFIPPGYTEIRTSLPLTKDLNLTKEEICRLIVKSKVNKQKPKYIYNHNKPKITAPDLTDPVYHEQCKTIITRGRTKGTQCKNDVFEDNLCRHHYKSRNKRVLEAEHLDLRVEDIISQSPEYANASPVEIYEAIPIGDYQTLPNQEDLNEPLDSLKYDEYFQDDMLCDSF